MLIGLKAMLNGTLAREAARERDGPRLLDELDRKLRERARTKGRGEWSGEADNVTLPCRQHDVYGENRRGCVGVRKIAACLENCARF